MASRLLREMSCKHRIKDRVEHALGCVEVRGENACSRLRRWTSRRSRRPMNHHSCGIDARDQVTGLGGDAALQSDWLLYDIEPSSGLRR